MTKKDTNCSQQSKLEVYPDGTKKKTDIISPNIPAKEKKATMKAMRQEGKTQVEIAEATGTSQATVSKMLSQ